MSQDPQRMDLEQLTTTCQQESGRFFRDETPDDRFCYELFRRALELHNQFAWEAIWTTYRNLVSGWLRNSSGYDYVTAPLDELVVLSFEKFWLAFTPPTTKSFSQFPSLQAVLQYLRLCTASTLTDSLRRRKVERFFTDIDAVYDLSSGQKPERLLVENEERTKFWREIQGLLGDEEERLLVRCYFVQGDKPRQIHARYPQYFPTIQDVYRVKRRVMSRLRRAESLRDYGLSE